MLHFGSDAVNNEKNLSQMTEKSQHLNSNERPKSVTVINTLTKISINLDICPSFSFIPGQV